MLRKVRIENVGPIRDTTLELAPFTVLLGANGSGKSSLLRSVNMLGVLMTSPTGGIRVPGGSLATPQGFARLVHKNDLARQCVWNAWLDSTDPAMGADYSLRLGIDVAGITQALRELLTGTNEEAPKAGQLHIIEERISAPHGEALVIDADHPTVAFGEVVLDAKTSRPISIAAALRNPLLQLPKSDRLAAIQDTLRRVGKIAYYRPQTAAMLAPPPSGLPPGKLVGENGEGFFEALATLQNTNREAFLAIERGLQAEFPHIQQIGFSPATWDDGERPRTRLILEFRTDRAKLPVYAGQEADGVLSTVFFLWALSQVEPEGTLLIDEPEIALHPRLMGRRVELLRRYTGAPRRRVLVATQSVDFVRYCHPEEIRIVEYSEEAGTTVRPMEKNPHTEALLADYAESLGELWYSGAIGGTPA